MIPWYIGSILTLVLSRDVLHAALELIWDNMFISNSGEVHPATQKDNQTYVIKVIFCVHISYHKTQCAHWKHQHQHHHHHHHHHHPHPHPYLPLISYQHICIIWIHLEFNIILEQIKSQSHHMTKPLNPLLSQQILPVLPFIPFFPARAYARPHILQGGGHGRRGGVHHSCNNGAHMVGRRQNLRFSTHQLYYSLKKKQSYPNNESMRLKVYLLLYLVRVPTFGCMGNKSLKT